MAQALGSSGYDVKLSMEVLTKSLQYKTQSPAIQRFAIESIESIADELQKLAYTIANKEDQKKDWLEGLNLAVKTLEENNFTESDSDKN